MKVKKLFQNIFYEEQKISDQRFSVALQARILDQVEAKGNGKKHWNPIQKYFLFPAVSIALAALIFGIFFKTDTGKSNKTGGNYSLIPRVSAEGILKDMQASINSDRLHFTMQESMIEGVKEPNSEDMVDSLGPSSFSETWIDRKAHIARLDRKDNKGRTRVHIIIKGLPDKSTTYQFVTSEQQNLEESRNKVGIFVSREDHDGYESIIDLAIKKDYIQLMKNQGLEVDPKYEEINYQGHSAYKITLKYAKHKPKQVALTEIFTIDKETKLPYEQLFTESGPEPEDEERQFKTVYSFSTNFGDDVFDLKAPEGYTLMQNPKIVFFYPVQSGEGYINQAKNQEEAWRRRKILSVSVSDGINSIGGTRGGLLPTGYAYKLFVVKKVFHTEEEAKNVKDLQYEEIKPHETDLKQNNYPNKVYTFPDIPDNTFNPRHFIIMKLEVTDQKGKKYEVKQIISLSHLISPEFLRY